MRRRWGAGQREKGMGRKGLRWKEKGSTPPNPHSGPHRGPHPGLALEVRTGTTLLRWNREAGPSRPSTSEHLPGSFESLHFEGAEK